MKQKIATFLIAAYVLTVSVLASFSTYSQQRISMLRVVFAKPYSMVSYVWGVKYQQSNQWALETLAAAMEPATILDQPGESRSRAQAWLKFKAYEPTTLNIRPLTRLGGRVTAANIAFDDHPNDKRFSDRIETVTVDSVFDWLQRAQLVPAGKVPTVVQL